MAERTIDLNSDLGEAFGAYRLGPDEELLPLVSSANIACGFHAGDPRVMARTVQAAGAYGVGVGAHPGFLDLAGFGRREIVATPSEITTDVLYQIGALAAFCRAANVPLRHVKAHGALYNRAVKDQPTADAIADAVRQYDPSLIFVALPNSTLERAARAAGVPVAREGFADRAYNSDGSLASRHLPGAVLHEPAMIAERAVRLVRDGVVTALDGSMLDLPIETLCLHSDTPGAVAIAHAIRAAFADAGIAVGPMQGR